MAKIEVHGTVAAIGDGWIRIEEQVTPRNSAPFTIRWMCGLADGESVPPSGATVTARGFLSVKIGEYQDKRTGETKHGLNRAINAARITVEATAASVAAALGAEVVDDDGTYPF